MCEIITKLGVIEVDDEIADRLIEECKKLTKTVEKFNHHQKQVRLNWSGKK